MQRMEQWRTQCPISEKSCGLKIKTIPLENHLFFIAILHM